MAEPIATQIYILLPPQVLLLDVAGPAEVFYFANRYQQDRHFSLHFIAPEPSVISAVGLPLAAQPLPDTLPDGAILLLPGMSGDAPDWAHPANQALLGWLRSQGAPGHHLCRCPVGGAGWPAGWSSLHHPPQPLCPISRVGAQSAAQVARNLVVYLRRDGGEGQFSPWLAWRNHLHPAIHRVQDALAAEPARSWDLTSAAELACVTPRHLTRLFREQTGITLMAYLNQLRLALAEELLLHSELSVERIAERAGFADGHQLRRVWRRLRSGTPTARRG